MAAYGETPHWDRGRPARNERASSRRLLLTERLSLGPRASRPQRARQREEDVAR
jgi:hypothetical protein